MVVGVCSCAVSMAVSFKGKDDLPAEGWWVDDHAHQVLPSLGIVLTNVFCPLATLMCVHLTAGVGHAPWRPDRRGALPGLWCTQQLCTG